MNRVNKDQYYLNIAKEVAKRSTCVRRQYGAVIVKNDVIISTGYNGAPRKTENCSDIGICKRQELHIPAGERYELCRAVHAEANAIINASKSDMENSTIYLFGVDYGTQEALSVSECCMMCKRLIINSGISSVKSFENNEVKTTYVTEWIGEL